MTSKLAILGLGVALIASACGNGATDAEDASGSEVVVEDTPTSTTAPAAPSTTEAADEGPQPAVSVLPEGPSALRVNSADEFPPPLVDPELIVPGGPPPDGIPPIEDPVFLDVVDALERFDAAEAVVALEVDGDARAYPVQVMIWHEIVNDTVGGIPVSITYCPLCNSAVTYRREIRGVETTFGTSGRLFSSALVMYDRATETLWTHFDGKAVVGLLAGEELESLPSPLMAWGDFAATYPTGRVLDPDATGHSRDYGRNPYAGYDDETTEPFLFRGVVDPRAASKLRVVGVAVDDQATAFALDLVAGGDANATNAVVGETDIVIFWKAGQATALESREIEGGRDVGSVAVFLPVVDGENLVFAAEGGGFVDEQTGSVWNLAGEAVEGQFAGARLQQIPHLDTFWFAWATYQPGTELIEPAE
ncbi:MAG: DUF3179 domain-containing protein [Acidimicrobiia bacterium]|nr:DUF3179 domain-containing protein [Acidimicrobiia bacterium]